MPQDKIAIFAIYVRPSDVLQPFFYRAQVISAVSVCEHTSWPRPTLKGGHQAENWRSAKEPAMILDLHPILIHLSLK